LIWFLLSFIALSSKHFKAHVVGNVIFSNIKIACFEVRSFSTQHHVDTDLYHDTGSNVSKRDICTKALPICAARPTFPTLSTLGRDFLLLLPYSLLFCRFCFWIALFFLLTILLQLLLFVGQ